MAIVRTGRLCSDALTELQTLWGQSRVALATTTVMDDNISFQYSFHLILLNSMVFLRATSYRQLRVRYVK